MGFTPETGKTARQPARGGNLRFKDIRLMLVDDEDPFREALARRLTLRGLAPVQARCGENCLELLENHCVDVVVLDVKMPGLCGLNTLKAIRHFHAGTRVILLTGHLAVRDGLEGIRHGAFDYLTKPVEIDRLIQRIQQAAGI